MRICIGIPTLDGRVTSSLALFLAGVCRDPAFRVFVVDRCGPVEHARNLLVESFLRTGDDALWFLDADMLPGQETLALLDHASEADIITGRAVVMGLDEAAKMPVMAVAAFDRVASETGFDAVSSLVTEPTRIVACGMACTLIHRRVFERIPLFRREYGPTGQVLRGEDLIFSHEAHLAGFSLLYVPQALIGHEKSLDLGYIERAMDGAYTVGCLGRQREAPQDDGKEEECHQHRLSR